MLECLNEDNWHPYLAILSQEQFQWSDVIFEAEGAHSPQEIISIYGFPFLTLAFIARAVAKL
jgi:hypothetical protein